MGLVPCYLRLSSLNPAAGPRRRIKALVRTNGRYRPIFIDPPRLIHNRAIHLDRRSTRKLEILARNGFNIYNLHTRYSKLFLHNLLWQNPLIRPHLPQTLHANAANLQEMMTSFPALIIKPENGSVGQGIMLLSQTRERSWVWKYRTRSRSRWSNRSFTRTPPAHLISRIRQRRYLIQQFLPLAKFNGSPFDIRVSVQRNESGLWQLTGMVGKVARQGAFLTNVAQGGTVIPLEILLSRQNAWDPVDLKHRIGQLSLTIAEYMSVHLPGLADLGLDMGIMEDGHLIFIEANGRDQRYSFQEAGMADEFKATYRNPMAYASYLSKTHKSP